MSRTAPAQLPHNSRGCPPALTRTSPAAGGFNFHRTTSPKCPLTAETPYITCTNTHTNSQSQCRESRQMEMMMAAERRRVEKELPRQTQAAWLPPPVTQATPSAGKRAATRKSRFRIPRRRASDTPRSTDDEQREPAFRASVAAHLRCRIIARPGCCAHGGCPWPGPAPRSCRAPRRRGRARPCPRTMRQPSPGAPASGGRRCAACRSPWPRPAARRARP